MPTKVVLVGATGSIGAQALDVITRFPDQFQLVGAVAGSRAAALAAALERFPGSRGVVVGPSGELPSGITSGMDAACELAGSTDADVVLIAGGGAAALLPTLAACEAGHLVALAVKEVLVMAGELVTGSAAEHGATIMPVDSEHSAIWQCLRGEDPESVARLILTGSGGPFRQADPETLRGATPEQALAHPNWRMGPKVTVDSATLMNKGLEVIEAHFLFGVPYQRIQVLIQAQSRVHSAVEFQDGSVIAQLGVPDMRAPISLALSGGRRLPGVVEPLALGELGRLDFEPADEVRFPALRVARSAALRGQGAAAALNAANEVAVAAFLDRELRFDQLVPLVEEVTEAFPGCDPLDLPALLEADAWARRLALELVQRRAAEQGPAAAVASL